MFCGLKLYPVVLGQIDGEGSERREGRREEEGERGWDGGWRGVEEKGERWGREEREERKGRREEKMGVNEGNISYHIIHR